MATFWVIAERILLRFLRSLRLIILLLEICFSFLKGRRKLTFVEYHLVSNVLLPPSNNTNATGSSHQPCGIGIIKVRKLRPRKVTAHQRQSQDSIPALGPKPCGFYHTRLLPAAFAVKLVTSRNL